MKTIIVDGVEYAPVIKGDRKLVVLDRGWIFAGNVKPVLDKNLATIGYNVTDCFNVRKWDIGGSGGLTKGAKSSKATLDPAADFYAPLHAVMFLAAISDRWEDE